MFCFLTRLLCESHNYVYESNIYGDAIYYCNARTVYRCTKCGKGLLIKEFLRE